MTPKTIDVFINQIYTKPLKKNPTNKTNVYHIDDICSLDTLGLKDYDPENKGGYRHVSVVINKFSKFGWTNPLKNEKG